MPLSTPDLTSVALGAPPRQLVQAVSRVDPALGDALRLLERRLVAVSAPEHLSGQLIVPGGYAGRLDLAQAHMTIYPAPGPERTGEHVHFGVLAT